MFKYKLNRPRHDDLPLGTPTVVRSDETLTGWVNGNKASDIEERFARALSSIGKEFAFRLPVISPRNMLGWLEVDFLVAHIPYYYPIQIDGEYAHKNESKKQKDAMKDILVYENLRNEYGNVVPVIRIPGSYLATHEEAVTKAKDIFI